MSGLVLERQRGVVAGRFVFLVVVLAFNRFRMLRPDRILTRLRQLAGHLALSIGGAFDLVLDTRADDGDCSVGKSVPLPVDAKGHFTLLGNGGDFQWQVFFVPDFDPGPRQRRGVGLGKVLEQERLAPLGDHAIVVFEDQR